MKTLCTNEIRKQDQGGDRSALESLPTMDKALYSVLRRKIKKRRETNGGREKRWGVEKEKEGIR